MAGFFDSYDEEPDTRYASVLAALERLAGSQYGHAEAPLSAIAAEAGLSVRTVQRHLNDLSAGHWISIGRRDTYQGANCYYLLTAAERAKGRQARKVMEAALADYRRRAP